VNVRVVAAIVVTGCAHSAAPVAISNRAPAPSLAHVCRDQRAEGRTVSMYVSADPNDTGPVDSSFDRAWGAARPRFDACRSGASQLAAVHFHVDRGGSVYDVETFGPDPAFDACVCEVIWKLSFPAQRVPVFASFGI
jgi:hypothetical protein